MITSVNPNALTPTPGKSAQTLDQNAFLRLMTTQLKEQDPFDPVDNQEMVAQMAQFSSVAGIGEMNVSLKSIADQITAQTAILSEIRNRSEAPAVPTV